VESSCEFGIEPSGSINSGKLSSVLTRDLPSSAQLLGVSYGGLLWLCMLPGYACYVALTPM
jgi:hypothetical protein